MFQRPPCLKTYPNQARVSDNMLSCTFFSVYSVHVHSDGDMAQGMLLIPLIKVHSWGHSEHISLQVTPALGFWPDSFPRLCRYRQCLKIGHPELPSLFWAKISLQTYLFKV